MHKNATAAPGRALKTVLLWALLPLLVAQGLWVRRRVPRLPEASGPVAGVIPGAAPPLRILLLGESTMAGVGIASHGQALGGQTAAALAARTGRTVHWQVVARNGATAATLPGLVVEASLPAAADVAVIALGVNDAVALRSAAQWQRDLNTLISGLRERLPSLPVVLAAVPPLARFPALPAPLREFLGLRAAVLDEATRALAQRLSGVRHAPMPTLETDDVQALFCADRFHPSEEGCRRWADVLSTAICALLNRPHPPTS